jgi:hypothetical protein
MERKEKEEEKKERELEKDERIGTSGRSRGYNISN